MGDKLTKWLDLVGSVIPVQHHDRRDSFCLDLIKIKKLSVQSMYNDVLQGVGVPAKRLAWKVKVPLKIKIFVWYLKQGVILTKDNFVK